MLFVDFPTGHLTGQTRRQDRTEEENLAYHYGAGAIPLGNGGGSGSSLQ
jgi:hypothetical protein